MIRIRYDENTPALEICGHAGHAPRGLDIVCAGVSALADALELQLTRNCREEDYDVSIEGSRTRITYSGEDPDAPAWFTMAADALEELARDWPACTRFLRAPLGNTEE